VQNWLNFTDKNITVTRLGPTGRIGLEDSLMNSQNVGSAILAERAELQTQAARGVGGVVPNATPEEMGLDDLVDYQPVPPRRIARIVVRYERAGRGKPLPYFIEEVSPE
jgi:hypothetical protein